eukprot:TRINITY_DN1400_c2_g1_i1.p2 TRINITY_DN1400_c2_g1~~TRINITY_DN1400_c2_g1_i1.p2  ORF type:complete len:124 (+),score=13.76 TRINITY_DN1400_c2_g1_i1:1748-2119(+)
MLTIHGPEFSKDKMKNKFKSYKKWYSAMKSMLNLSGFGWDEKRKKVTAEEGVWDDYIAEHPGHSMYRTRHMPDYLLMCEIFGDSIVDGRKEFVTFLSYFGMSSFEMLWILLLLCGMFWIGNDI